MIYSLATPSGVAIGIIIAAGNDIVNSIFMGIAAGTFIYISTVEIIVEEFSVSKYKWIKFFFFLLGISVMVLVFFVEQWTGS